MDITKTEVSSFQFRVSRENNDGWSGPVVASPLSGVAAWVGIGRRHHCKRGLWVVLLGPDGAGKSSVIARIGDGVAAGFAGCDAYHLQALSLRGRRRLKANCDPHGQAARGTLMTVLKLGYWFVLNWVGYLAVVLPRVGRGRLVLFDRYFPDCLVDRLRYRIPASCRWLAELAAKASPCPNLYLVLDVPAEVLRSRKQEVTAIEAERQCREYRRLAARMENAAMICAEGSADSVLEGVVQRIIEAHLSLPRGVPKEA
jgi:thymidylate kinase